MDVADFLRMVWPDEGVYALATPFTPDGQSKTLYTHKVFDSVAAAVAAVNQLKTYKDVFFCIHSLAEARVWNPKKVDPKTKQLGAYEVRVQSNMLKARALFFDLDVGPGDHKYPSQLHALTGLKDFVAATQLPRPLIASSGGGLHVYWPLVESLPSADWRVLATKLKTLAQHHALLADPMRTTDTSSVLRVPGTFNRKDPTNPRPVRLLYDRAEPTPVEDMSRRLDAALIRAGKPTAVDPLERRQIRPFEDMLGSNIQTNSGPPVGFPALVSACKQLRYVVAAKGAVSEPLWYAMLGLVRYCDKGDAAAHYISKGHPDYDFDDTEQKLHQLETKMVGPTTCAKIESVNPGGCEGCPREGVVKSPLSAARQTEQAPAPVMAPPLGLPDAVEVAIPPPPPPYMRLSGGAIGVEMGIKDDPDKRETVTILPYDFHPLRRLTDIGRGVETHAWNVNLPRVGYTQIALDADAMYDVRKLASVLANKGIFPQGDSINLLRSYMVAYINTLQSATDAEILQTNLGWTDDYNAFVMPEKVIHHDGTVKPTNLSLAATRATAAIHKRGTLEEQVRLLKFFAHPDYAANQFAVCAALGAPLFFATGHHGVVVNMSGPPGASKSTTLYTGASLWGDPLGFCINGTTRGATHNARDNRMAITANLPQMVDEITRMQPRDAADLAMGVTQSEGRLRLDASGIERRQVNSNKSTIMLCTANTSLYTVLSVERADSTAESMRVFEMQFDLNGVHTKAQADAYLVGLRENYGHLGELFISHVVKNRAKVVDRVRAIMKAVDQAASIQAGERFWSAAAATALAACEIANELGLLYYKPKVIWEWLLKTQLPAMRNTLQEQYTPPIGVLAEYMELVNGNMLVLQRGAMRNHENIPNVIRQPQNGQLLARLEIDSGQMWIMKKSFRDYCARYGHNFTRILDQLAATGVVVKKHDRKVLGAGTEYAKGQSWCFTINMHHKDVVGEQMVLKKPSGKVLPFETVTGVVNEGVTA